MDGEQKLTMLDIDLQMHLHLEHLGGWSPGLPGAAPPSSQTSRLTFYKTCRHRFMLRSGIENLEELSKHGNLVDVNFANMDPVNGTHC